MRHFELRLVAWEMTQACNLACVHCRAGACSEPSPEELTTDEGRALIDSIAKVGKPILIMTGGEPLIRADFFDLARYAMGAGLRAVLATNGCMVTPDVAKDISAIGIPRVSISIDGPTPKEHDAFRKVDGAFDASMAGIENLRHAGVPVQNEVTRVETYLPNETFNSDFVRVQVGFGNDSVKHRSNFYRYLILEFRVGKIASTSMATSSAHNVDITSGSDYK